VNAARNSFLLLDEDQLVSVPPVLVSLGGGVGSVAGSYNIRVTTKTAGTLSQFTGTPDLTLNPSPTKGLLSGFSGTVTKKVKKSVTGVTIPAMSGNSHPILWPSLSGSVSLSGTVTIKHAVPKRDRARAHPMPQIRTSVVTTKGPSTTIIPVKRR
jgi:hypothetical protein